MGRMRVAVAAGVLLCVGSCRGPSYPTSPTPQPRTPLAPTEVRVQLSPMLLPPGGGDVSVRIETVNSINPAANATVTLRATAGSLERDTITTDHTGHATLTWTTDRSGEVIAEIGELVGRASVQVGSEPPNPFPPTPNPNPNPGPAPGPTPPGPNPPAPNPPAPRPNPAGDLVLSIAASPAAPASGQSVTLSATLTSTSGATVPAIRQYVWDVNNDRLPDHIGEATPIVTFTAGSHPISLTVTTADNREVTGTLSLSVGPTPPAPSVTVTLAASPNPAAPNASITLTATATPNSTGGTVTSYRWDFDANDTVDQTTPGPSTTTSYPTVGAKTARVTAVTSSGATGTGERTINVTAPAITIDLSVSPGGAQPAGTSRTFTATVTPTSGTVPTPLTFEWDWNNDGIVDETTTGGTTTTAGHVYNAPGVYVARVTVKASDGRTATDTVAVTVS